MELLTNASVSPAAGVEGDYKGAKYPRRQITILAIEDWKRAISDVGSTLDNLPWHLRRANILTEGWDPAKTVGSLVTIGDIQLEVTGLTTPCSRMEEIASGLLKALWKDGRGGIACRVTKGGVVSLGDCIATSKVAPGKVPRRLPG